MGAIGQLFAGLFGFLFAFFARYLTAKILIAAAVISTFLIMLGALTLAFNAALLAIESAVPAEFAWGLGIIPNNIPLCVSTILTARVTIWLFQVKWAIVKVKLQA